MPAEAHNPRTRAEWLVPLLVLCAVVLTFGRVVGFQFVFDDSYLILNNSFIQSAANIPRYFTEHFWTGVSIAQKNYYRPLSLLWLLGSWKLFGPNPAGWHALCILLHSLNTLLVYLLARRFFGPAASGPLAAGAAAALFGLHPIQAEVVSWVSCFNDLLATLLLLCSFHAWLNARGAATIPKNAIVGHPESAPAEEGPDFRSEQAGSSPQSRTLGTPEFGMTEDPRRYSRNRLWYGLSLAGYAAALQCKEPAALFPVFLLIFDLSGVQAGEAPAAPPSSFFARLRAALLRLVPFLVVAAIYLLLRRHALGSITTPQVRIISARTEWLTLPSVLLAYLTHLIWPEGLSPLYDVPYVETFSFAAVALPLLTVMLPAGLLLWAAWRSPMARFCFAWMLVFAAPTLHLAVLPRGELVHDRYLYLPMVGLSLLAGLGLAAVMDFQGQSSGLSRAQEAAGRPLFDATWVAGALALALMLVAGRQAGYWRDNFTLFLRGIQIAPNNGIAAGNLGIEFWKRGDREAATALFRRAATLNPDIFEADKRAGYEHYQAGHYAEAEQAFGVAVATRPDDAFSHMMLGLIYLKTRRPAAAVAEGRRAVELAPLDPGFHYGLGNILEATGDLVGARDAYRAELAIRPDHKSSQQELHRIEQILAAAKSQ